jgi:hypothetical protein
MNIQDLIFALGGLIFAIALLPSIRSSHKPALSTCIMSTAILTAFSINDLTFDHPLYFAFVTTGLNALAWVVLAVQQFRLARTHATC